MDATNQMKLNDATLNLVMRNNDITKDQAMDLWDKSVSFNNILKTKYGDTYNNNLDEITRIMHQYQNKLVAKYKN